MVDVGTTDEFLEWYESLDRVEVEAVWREVELLRQSGLALGHPHSSQIKRCKYAFRELRVQGRPLRVLYAFDPRREAILILGGDKTGDDRFYERMVPRAEKIWEQYLEEQEAGLHDEGEESDSKT